MIDDQFGASLTRVETLMFDAQFPLHSRWQRPCYPSETPNCSSIKNVFAIAIKPGWFTSFAMTFLLKLKKTPKLFIYTELRPAFIIPNDVLITSFS